MRFRPCIDIAHGGADHGAEYNGHVEKDRALEVGKLLDASFCGTPIVPITTRQGDYYPSWEARYKIAKDAGATFVIAPHFNANRDHNVSGGEAYHYPTNRLTRAAGRTFLECLPPELHRLKLYAATDKPTVDDDWLQRPLTIINAFHELPVLVAECGYLSNESDAAFLHQPWALHAVVCALRCAIIRAAHLQEMHS